MTWSLGERSLKTEYWFQTWCEDKSLILGRASFLKLSMMLRMSSDESLRMTGGRKGGLS